MYISVHISVCVRARVCMHVCVCTIMHQLCRVLHLAAFLTHHHDSVLLTLRPPLRRRFVTKPCTDSYVEGYVPGETISFSPYGALLVNEGAERCGGG